MPLLRIDLSYMEFGSPADWICHVDLVNYDFSKVFQEDLEELRKKVNEKYGETDDNGNILEAYGGVVLRVLKIKFTDRAPLYCFTYLAINKERSRYYIGSDDYTSPVCPPFDRKRPPVIYHTLKEISDELNKISKVFTRMDLEKWAIKLNPNFAGFKDEKSNIPQEIELNKIGLSQLFKQHELPMPTDKQLNQIFAQ